MNNQPEYQFLELRNAFYHIFVFWKIEKYMLGFTEEIRGKCNLIPKVSIIHLFGKKHKRTCMNSNLKYF